MSAVQFYYFLKPLIPRSFQIRLRRRLALKKRNLYRDVWPIDPKACEAPKEWNGWPEQKDFALVLTHDVDTAKGQENVRNLAELEESLGFRSSFNFVPERYSVSSDLRVYLTDQGFEVGVHGLCHDGKLYSSRKIFRERAEKINNYLKEWESAGFRSPAMHHNLDWLHDLDIEYDASTFDTDPFQPQPEGVGTIFPFVVHKDSSDTSALMPPGLPASQPSTYEPFHSAQDFQLSAMSCEVPRFFVELPYTLPQDFEIFVLMGENNIDIWKEKLDWLIEKKGMALVNVHPDYMNFSSRKCGMEEYPADYYLQFLDHVKVNFSGRYWAPLPREMAGFWSSLPRVASTAKAKVA